MFLLPCTSAGYQKSREAVANFYTSPLAPLEATVDDRLLTHSRTYIQAHALKHTVMKNTSWPFL